MNPLGVVPSLEEDDGFTLFESNSIIRYLCNAYAPDSDLYPRAARDRAVVDTWLDFQQTSHNRPGSVVFQGLIRIAPEKRDHAAIAAATEELARVWAILDARLAERPFIAGDHLTLADIAFGPHIHRWFEMPMQGRPQAPNLRRWYRAPARWPRLQVASRGARYLTSSDRPASRASQVRTPVGSVNTSCTFRPNPFRVRAAAMPYSSVVSSPT